MSNHGSDRIYCAIIYEGLQRLLQFCLSQAQDEQFRSSKTLLLNESINESTNPRSPSKNTGSVVIVEGEEFDSHHEKATQKIYHYICGGIWLLIAIAIIFTFPPLIEMAIVEQTKEQVIMAPRNEEFPGDTHTIIVQNFTM